ncbi:UNVERIFIED_CONTAM: hypothetical protein PYX00_009764 [Menopon gallinae]|uniref:Uncharacterized protein n=1 Tax=Menopon gallinae TaxID=328185 RepID=A0AAW2HCG3_9NEOP
MASGKSRCRRLKTRKWWCDSDISSEDDYLLGVDVPSADLCISPSVIWYSLVSIVSNTKICRRELPHPRKRLERVPSEVICWTLKTHTAWSLVLHNSTETWVAITGQTSGIRFTDDDDDRKYNRPSILLLLVILLSTVLYTAPPLMLSWSLSGLNTYKTTASAMTSITAV